MAARIEIDVELGPAITNPPSALPFLKTGMDAAVELVRGAGERAMPGPSNRSPRKTGKGYGPLAGSLTTHVFTGDQSVGGFVRTPVFYARFLEYGTKARAPVTAKHRAKAGGKGRLRWGPASAPTFRLLAKHPAQRARHWLGGAAEGERAPIERVFEEQARAWAATFEKGA